MKTWKVISLCILGVFLIPLFLNFILLIPIIPEEYVYTGEWLGFFGSFLGASITVLGTVYVMRYTQRAEKRQKYTDELIFFKVKISNLFKEDLLDQDNIPIFKYEKFREDVNKYMTDCVQLISAIRIRKERVNNEVYLMTKYSPVWEFARCDFNRQYDNLLDGLSAIQMNIIGRRSKEAFDSICKHYDLEEPLSMKGIYSAEMIILEITNSELDRIKGTVQNIV